MFNAKTKKAFTIVELVIVIAVIAILMGIMFVGGTAISNNAKASSLDSDFRTFETNLKAMVNDPDASCIQTGTGATPAPFNPTTGDPKDLIEKYFEGDLAFSSTGALAALTGDEHTASREAYEGQLEMLDPYGVEYRVIVLDNSTGTKTDISFLVYSCGKNKQTGTDANDGLFDNDDVTRVIRMVDSVIYTGDFAATTGTTAYQAAVDAACPIS